MAYKVLALIQARMGSTRLPGKVMANLGHQSILHHVVGRVQRASSVDDCIVCTTSDKSDDIIHNWCIDNNIKCIRGSKDNVLQRFCDAIRQYESDYIVRITADDPMLEPSVISNVIMEGTSDNTIDYCSNILERSWPRGLDCELVKSSTLLKVEKLVQTDEDREHVTLFIRRMAGMFKTKSLVAPKDEQWPDLRLCVDSQQDLDFVREVWERLEVSGKQVCLSEILYLLNNEPNLLEINKTTKQTVVFGVEY